MLDFKVFQNLKISLRAAEDKQWGRQVDMPALLFNQLILQEAFGYQNVDKIK